MRTGDRRAPFRGLLSLAAGVGLLVVVGCTGQEGTTPTNRSATRSAGERKIPKLASAPTSPRLMQVYLDTGNGREWIYDGAGWVPHDRSVDDHAEAMPEEGAGRAHPGAQPRSALTVPFSPTGAHGKHGSFACTTCHLVGGSPCLDPTGPAAAPGQPAPAFDATTKTCSSVACHGAYSGTFTYYRWDWGIEDFEAVSVQYAGHGGAAASWYSTGSTCSSCHGNPPAPSGYWHYPTHGFSWMTVARQCETCHPDAISAVVGGKTVGVSINAASAALHANGVVNVQARFTSKCFGCH